MVFSIVWILTKRVGTCPTAPLHLYRQHEVRFSKWVSTLNSLRCHRCSHLHASQAIHDLNGLELLREALIAEYTRGHGTLPMVYRPYFYNSLQILLSRPPKFNQKLVFCSKLWITLRTHFSTMPHCELGLGSLLWSKSTSLFFYAQKHLYIIRRNTSGIPRAPPYIFTLLLD